MASIRTGWGRSDQRFVVAEDVFVIWIKVVVSDVDRIIFVFAKSIVKSGIQMVVLSINADNVPGMAVFDAFFRL